LLKGGLVKELSNRSHAVNPLAVSINGKGKQRLYALDLNPNGNTVKTKYLSILLNIQENP
jgi:hypothetical protein